MVAAELNKQVYASLGEACAKFGWLAGLHLHPQLMVASGKRAD